MKRLLFYSHDTYGLGNIRRMLAIVEHLIRQNPDYSALILSGSPMMQAFRLSPRIDYIKLPCLERGSSGKYAAKFLDMPYEKLLSLRADLILNALLNYEPDLIMVDKKPLGVQNEIAPALDVLARRANKPKLVLLLREILDDPATTREIWSRNGYHDTIREHYDQVLVVGAQNVFDTASEYQFPESTRSKLKYCGYIAKPHVLRDPNQVRKELGIGSQKLVVVTAGGGKDGHRLLDVALDGFRDARRPQETHLLLCLGPEMDRAEQKQLNRKAAGMSTVSSIEYTNDMMSYLNAADVVVSMAGYNTVTELISIGKPAVLVPRTTPVLEQWIRATRLEQCGLFSVVHPDQMTTRVFLAVLRRMLSELGTNQAPRTHVDLNALVKIDSSIAALLQVRKSHGWSQMLFSQDGVETGEFARPLIASLENRELKEKLK